MLHQPGFTGYRSPGVKKPTDGSRPESQYPRQCGATDHDALKLIEYSSPLARGAFIRLWEDFAKAAAAESFRFDIKMPKFILIDHSLKAVGGHHFDYSMHVVRAAQSLGFETALATNRAFRGRDEVPRNCRVFPLFRYKTYNRFTVFNSSTDLALAPSDGGGPDESSSGAGPRGESPTAGEATIARRGARRRIAAFARNCGQLFRQFPCDAGDHVFLATLSELDLLGLSQYLDETPQSARVDWHLQFHFNIFYGREPEYRQQENRRLQVRQYFETAIRRAPQHRLHFYSTCQPLAEQYNYLNVASFESLAYPINHNIFLREDNPRVPAPRIEKRRVITTGGRAPQDAGDQRSELGGSRGSKSTSRVGTGFPASRPLRVTCAGALRREKGHGVLSQLVEETWEQFATGELQLVVQSKKSRWSNAPRLRLTRGGRLLGKHRFTPPTDKRADEPVVYVRHPLEMSDYVALIRNADIGLLLYDSGRYYARRAGVLGEMLAAQVPVIVPAGCWLAEQIAEPNFHYLENLCGRLPAKQLHDLNQLALTGRDVVSQGPLDIPAGAKLLIAEFNRHRPAPGTYVRIESIQLDGNGNQIGRFESIVGARSCERPVLAATPLLPRAVRVRFNWSNAYGCELLKIDDVKIGFYDGQQPGMNLPLGQVGLIAANQDAVPLLLREIAANFDHYRTTAAQFSLEWFRRHAPEATVTQLVSRQSAKIDAA